MVDRTVSPKIFLTEKIDFPRAESIIMPNGVRLLVINQGIEDVCRVDLLFNAGSRYQQRNLEARAALNLLPEGTDRFTSREISEHFDFYGSFLNISVDKDFARITLSSLSKHLANTIEMLGEIITKPCYPENEFRLWCSRGKQELMVDLEKTSTLANQAFFRSIYGETHPYGIFASPDDYSKIQQPNLKAFHSSYIGSGNVVILLSGKITDNEINLIIKQFGTHLWGAIKPAVTNGIIECKPANGRVSIAKPGAVQSAIRVGRELFNRSHPDFPDIMFVNTLLGGYFGSRLMKNIREEKGYTYGIGSYISPFRDSGFFMISTEVGADYTDQTLREIKLEIDRLNNEPVSNEELSLVKSYLMGEILRNLNGAFPIADSIINLLCYNDLDYDYFDRLILSVKEITSKKIIDIANKWIPSNVLIECVVGPSGLN